MFWAPLSFPHLVYLAHFLAQFTLGLHCPSFLLNHRKYHLLLSFLFSSSTQSQQATLKLTQKVFIVELLLQLQLVLSEFISKLFGLVNL